MYHKTEDLNYDEKKYSRKISDILNWAKKSGRSDILAEADRIGTVTNMTNLKKAYGKLNQMKKTEKTVFSDNNNSAPMSEQPTPSPAATPAPENKPPQSPQMTDSTFHDPLLGANPKQRDYTAGLPSGNISSPAGAIPEPDFKGGATSFGSVPPNQPDNRFQSTQELPPNEKAKSSEELAKMLVDAYSTNVPAIFAYFSKVSEGKLSEMAARGEIDLNVVLNMGNQSISVGDYFKELNHQADQAFAVSEDWKAEILPYVIRILQKKAWGVTDEQVVMYMVGSHLVQCGIMTYQMKQNNNKLMEYLVENTRALRESGNLPPTPPPAAGQTPPPPPPAPTPPPPPQEPPIETVVAEEFHYEPPSITEDLTGTDAGEIAPLRFDTPRGGRARNNVPPESETESMPLASHITTGLAGQ